MIPKIESYDVICSHSGAIHSYGIKTREQADLISEGIDGSLVIPIIKTSNNRIGYAIRQGASS